METLDYMMVGYLIIWGLAFGLVFNIWSRSRRLEDELQVVRQMMDDREQEEPYGNGRPLAAPASAGLIALGVSPRWSRSSLFLILGKWFGRRAEESAAGDLTKTPFLALAVLSFFAGMLGFISPCTLPLLPAYFAVTFQSERKRVLVMTLAFMAGLAVTFAFFGALAGILGRALNSIGLSKFELARIGGVVIIIFGVMSLLGKGFTGIQSNSHAMLRCGALLSLGPLLPSAGPVAPGRCWVRLRPWRSTRISAYMEGRWRNWRPFSARSCS